MESNQESKSSRVKLVAGRSQSWRSPRQTALSTWITRADLNSETESGSSSDSSLRLPANPHLGVPEEPLFQSDSASASSTSVSEYPEAHVCRYGTTKSRNPLLLPATGYEYPFESGHPFESGQDLRRNPPLPRNALQAPSNASSISAHHQQRIPSESAADSSIYIARYPALSACLLESPPPQNPPYSSPRRLEFPSHTRHEMDLQIKPQMERRALQAPSSASSTSVHYQHGIPTPSASASTTTAARNLAPAEFVFKVPHVPVEKKGARMQSKALQPSFKAN